MTEATEPKNGGRLTIGHGKESLANQHHFKGYLQCDGSAGYETAFKTNPGVHLVNCLVHIRRHFEQALDENREMAEYGLTQIQKIYQMEHGCNDAGLSHEERRNKRQELARPILEAMKAWMEAEGVKYSHRSAKPSHMPISDGAT